MYTIGCQLDRLDRGFDKVGDEGYLKLPPKGQHRQTKGHSLKLAKPRHRTQKRSKFFNSRIINKWNSLTEYVVSSTSVNMFKNRYDQYETVCKLRRGTTYEL